MKRVLSIGATALTVAVVATVTAVAPAAAQRTASSCARGLSTVEVKPSGLLPLTANARSAATRVALLFLGRGVVPQATTTQLASSGRVANTFSCGAQVLSRTVIVTAQLCSAIPAKVFYVGRFQTGYRVWRVGS